MEYYTSDPLGGAHPTSELPEGTSSSVGDLVPDDHDDPESKTTDCPGCQFPVDGGAGDPLMLTVTGGDVDNGEHTLQILTDPVFPATCSSNSNDEPHCGTFAVPALAAPIVFDGSIPYFTSEP
ncbi:uncharacterized protein LOC144610467 [Rhinoraja longicauda]